MLVVAVSLVMDSVEPVVFEDHPAATTDRAVCVVIVGTVMRSVGKIVTIAKALILVGFDLHPVERF